MEPSSTAGLQLGPLSGSRRSASAASWGSRRSGSISHSLSQQAGDPFGRAASRQGHEDDEENLRWAALEKLPTYDRMRRAVILSRHAGIDGADGAGHELQGLVDINQLASGEAGRALLERVFQDDSERFLRRLRDRVDRVGIDLPAIEVRYQGLSVEVDAFVGSRALPTLWNSATNFLQL
ncbi:unnamed protein product [Triticum turgidum subsp. durum]|uniref:Pleiotropic ABC efflux transporter N-terminal domain-containing protein n=1 Tax=Triticum turgidum subsp. durum TaxID=4567 RepID=A0A9R0U101_TRITD|nr:unnamed protein product [Triticum turgidum subsp. durum]